ncbi:MAG: Unknown protein [uncultured Sulfurovum sp.]|uniref:Uncharacterized protein n=1 Tax=uncultured Sulfurovum sp. TaxID=269237 RepID=A0A6S6SG71_9BACT|nr:MAG: Unknown protein [uncultured Sulfurovum sp.]
METIKKNNLSFFERVKEFNLLESILTSLIPEEFEVSQLAIYCNKHNSTIRIHLAKNYKEGKDYYQKVVGGKILIARPVAIQIRRYYANKEK